MRSYRYLLILLFFVPLLSNAQDTIYFNQDWFVVDKAMAKQYTTINSSKDNDNQFFIKDFTLEGVLLAEYEYKGLLTLIDWTRIYEKGFHIFAVEDGVSREYYPSGGKKKELFYKSGLQKGLISIWNEKGQKVRSFYAENNVANGSYTTYFENGNTSFKVHFKNDTLQGTAIYYHENGEISKLGRFKNGAKTGKWQYISEEGKPIAEEVYKSTFFIDGPDVNVSFPEGKWYLADRYKEDGSLNFFFTRIGFSDSQEEESFPSCLITLDRVGNEITMIEYSSDRRSRLSIDVNRVLTKESGLYSLPNTIGYIGSTGSEEDKKRIVYLVHSLQNSIGVEMILDCEKENYDTFKEEFLFILKSLKK